MLHIIGFTLLFPAMCLFIVTVLGGFRLIVDFEALFLGFWVAYAFTIVPGAITAIADFLLSGRSIRFRFLYCASIAAVATPIVALWIYPGKPYFFWSNVAFCASIGAASAALCSLAILAMRYRTHVNP